MFDESDPGTWSVLPAGYRWLPWDHTTGEHHLYAPDGRDLSGEPYPHSSVLNAVIAAAMIKYAYRPPRYEWQREHASADPSWRGWANMRPVVTATAKGPTDPFCPDDVWWVEVQYNTAGSRASFGVDRNNVPQCYQD